ncbi:MAG: hypothetical protein HYZ58_08825 [Acidobacteria bacterium]|nr:hypothetical protein [Acidobacteriota bacterium]
MLLALIERAGVTARDEAMEIYTRVCEHLAADDCTRLRRHDPGKGALRAWLTVVVRRIVVDWVRSRVGRRRLFKTVAALDPLARRVFELFYWSDYSPPEIVELLRVELGQAVSLVEVLDALDRIHGVLTDRHRSELVSLATRSRPSVSLEDEEGRLQVDPPSDRDDPERIALRKEFAQRFGAAVAMLPADDAAILRLRFVQGLTLAEIQKALHLERLSHERITRILAAIRSALERPLPPRASVAPSSLPLLGGRVE